MEVAMGTADFILLYEPLGRKEGNLSRKETKREECGEKLPKKKKNDDRYFSQL